MDGFADATVTLRRRIDRDYPDTEIFNSVVITGDDGWVAYEGIIVGEPRAVDEGHSITVQCAGWMRTTKDAKFSRIYLDRGLEGWGAIPRARWTGLLTDNLTPHNGQAEPDAGGKAGITTRWEGAWGATYRPAAESWYDAGPNNRVRSIHYRWEREGAGVDPANANFQNKVHVTPDEGASVVYGDGNRFGTGPESRLFTAPVACRYAFLQFFYSGGAAGTDGQSFGIRWSDLSVIGDHGLPLLGEAPYHGLAASDVIRHIVENHCPKLNANGVQETTYPLPQVAFKSRVFPYDAMLEVNAAHLWDLAVWDNRTLHYGPVILVDHDWEVRLSDHGVSGDIPGDTVEDLANGIAVEYDDVATGRTEVLLPLDHPELQDPDVDHPATRHGFLVETDLTLGLSTRDVALQMGRAALAERNQPKAAGALVIRGHVQDRYGTWQPAYRIRAGDTISVMDHPNSRPRLVVETSWNNDSKTMTVALDSTLKRLDAILDRMSSAITAANLS